MAITKVWLEEGCVTCGVAETICPELFKLDYEKGRNNMHEGVDLSKLEDKIKKAASACYAGCIKYEES